ncbi:MAG TPA: histidine phosphatase family protein [Pirellulaceae bacterium]|nr:histidine phosphatase family protein [Pirellulaceae bacterium]
MHKTLLLMRHAKSSWADEHVTDHQRSLNKRGLKDAPRMARHLATKGLIPQMIACSTATRARQTLELLLAEWPAAIQVSIEDELYLTSAERYLLRAARFPDSCQVGMIIAHNPGLEILAGRFDAGISHLPTAAVAVIRSQWSHWDEVTLNSLDDAEVVLFRPKSLD